MTVSPAELGHSESGQITRLREQARRSYVSSDVARLDRHAVWRKTFRSDVRRWIALYDLVGQRDGYLWQWCLHGIELTTLPCVDREWFDRLCDLKLLSVIVCVLLDDVADCGEPEAWLSALLQLCGQSPLRPQREVAIELPSAHELKHLESVRQLWEDYESGVAALPQFDTFEPVWRFDLSQFFNAMKYGHLANRYRGLLNPTEHDVYSPHNMLMVSFSTLDLMASPCIPDGELSALREAIWHAQAMGRVGNVLSTWRREVAVRDFTGGIFSRAIRSGILTADELEQLSCKELEQRIRNSGMESELLAKWERHRNCFQSAAAQVSALDMEQLLAGHDRFLEMHLQSTGLI